MNQAQVWHGLMPGRHYKQQTATERLPFLYLHFPLTLTLSPEGRGDGTVLLQAGKTLAMKLPVIP